MIDFFSKEVNSQNLWNFELDSQETMNVPMRIIVGFEHRDRQDSQLLNDDSFFDCQLLVLIVLFG